MILPGRLAAQEVQPFQFTGPTLVLSPTSVQDALRTIKAEQLPEVQPANPTRLRGVTPLTEKLWRIALRDIESNEVETANGRYFGAGTTFGLRIYTRDISFSGVMGLNRLYPELMKSSLEVTRKIRFALGLKVSKGYAVPGIHAAWEELDLTEKEFLKKYNTNSYTRRTDDVVWLWAASDLFAHNPGLADYEWLYTMGKACFEAFYDPFFDPADGLYRGQATFVDIHFLNHQATGYPLDYTTQDCVLLKPLSLNSLYVKGLDVMSEAAKRTGREAEAKVWQERADRLRQAISQHLRNAEGRLVYFKNKDGELQPRRDALGIALAVLFDVVAGDDARKQFEGYPVTDAGVPLFLPFFTENPRAYHNNTSWPFVDTFFLAAYDKAFGTDRTAENAALLARTCVGEGSFHEWVNFQTKEPLGSGAQLWSAAGFVSVCYRAGLVAPAGHPLPQAAP